MRNKLIHLVVIPAIACLFYHCTTDFELVITDGTVYDGTGDAPYSADIGIKNGTIEKIGRIRPGKARVIDASGLYVAPGFIDMHTHCDFDLTQPEKSSAKNYLTQGVTTVVTGNCGHGSYKVAEFFRKLDSIGIGPNVVHQVGHNTVRRAVLGTENRVPTQEEMEQMKDMVSEGMKGGAVGFTTGLYYVPGTYAQTDEIIEIGKRVKELNGIYASHIRDESNYTTGLLASIEEAIEIGEATGLPVQISHIKALGKPVWGLSDEVCTLIEEARERGLNIMADQYPYSASSTSVKAALIPHWVREGVMMEKRLNDNELLPRIRQEIAGNIDRRGGPDALVVLSFEGDDSYVGKSLGEISQLLGKSPVETAIYLILNGGSSLISFNMIEEDIQYFMKKDYVMTSSDGQVAVAGKGNTHPRNYGTFTRKIRKYVLEDEIISMEHAVKAATRMPALMLGMDNRGKIETGYVADLTIFNPETIRDNATFENPHRYSTGIEYLLVNGEIVIENGEYNGKLAGIPLRMNR